MDDSRKIRVNNGWRIQFNNTLGPYKGGLRFRPTVNAGILKFLAFEQVFKNALTGLSMGGAKGGSDFDPKGKSETEVMSFCSSFMRQLYQYIGPRIDVPAGDMGVGSREIGYLFGEYKRITHHFEGAITGKPFTIGGSLVRPEATGYGVVYFANEMLANQRSESLSGKICCVSGAGNVAIHTIEKLLQVGALPITCSDSQGAIYDPDGIDISLLKDLKLTHRNSLAEYIKNKPKAKYIKTEEYSHDSHLVWSIPCYAAFACATQNELTLNDAKNLISNGCQAVIEGANMPSTPDAIATLRSADILFAPAKAANAGGVVISQVEMSQNASMIKLPFEVVESKLEETMKQIYYRVSTTAKEYGKASNLTDGANIAAFIQVADAMLAAGV
jgi:glutamate dehydrogenase (NADP+)